MQIPFWAHASQRLCGPGVFAILLVAGLGTAASGQDVYAGHPKLLFAANDIEALRSKVSDGGDDDTVYLATRQWAQGALLQTPASLTVGWEGINTVAPLGLLAHLEPDGAAYAAKVREVALWLARNRAPSNDEFASGLRLQTMALGYDLAGAGATPAERAELRTAMRSFLDYMPPRFNYYCQAYNPYCGNHGMTAGAGIGLAVLALWNDVSPAGRDSLAASLAFGETLVNKCLSDILPPDGAYREGVLYAGWIVRVGAPYFEARRRFDGFDYGADPRLQRMIEWLCYELAPDGTGRTNNLNDSPWSTRPLAMHGTILEWAQFRWQSGLARYLHDHVVGTYGYDYGIYADRVATILWNQPLAATPPGTVLPSGRLFPDRGLYYYRSGWKTGAIGDEVSLAFSTGIFYGGHTQEDRNQFTLAAYGQRFIVDCGAVGSTATPKQSEAHNVVLVDGRGQHNAGNSIGIDASVAAALCSGFADFVRSDARSAYATYSPFNAPGVPFPASDWSWGYDGGVALERASRTCGVIKGPGAPPWFLIVDDMRQDASPHTWDWLLHTSNTNTLDLTRDPAQITSPQAACDVFFAHPRPPAVALTAAPFSHGGVDPPTNRIVARTTDVEPRFVVALVPRATGMPAPVYSTSDDGGSTALALDWGTVRDAAAVSPRHVLTTGELQTDATLAVVRSQAGAPSAWLVAEGTDLVRAGTALFHSDNGLASAAFDGTALVLDSNDAVFSAWAPGVTSITGPSGPIAVWHDGDFVRRRLPADAGGTPGLEWAASVGPNPARETVRVRFALARPERVRAWVVDVRGRVVTRLADGERGAGIHEIEWAARRRGAARTAPGVYFVRLETDTHARGVRVVLGP